MNTYPIPTEKIETKIFIIRGQKTMLDRDLADLYGVPTKRLNEQVRRNLVRFPSDFMFRLTQTEKNELVANCDRLKSLKYSTSMPYVFTEHGAVMLASILNSKQAIEMSIFVVRAFSKLREMVSTHRDFYKKLEILEKKYQDHDKKLKNVFQAIKELLNSPKETLPAIPEVKGFTSQN